jgi:hypothetical protein
MIRSGPTVIIFVLGSLVLLVGGLPRTQHHPVQAKPLLQAGCPAVESPGPLDSQPGALEIAAKSQAFEEVVQEDGQYEDYLFQLDTTQTPPGFILPVLPMSIAGIESDWSQYDTGRVTRRNINPDGSCDDGIMQVNSSEELSTRQPSYLSDIRGNIAAGVQVLAGKWNRGVPGVSDGIPVVNDIDPELLIHWYHALSAYNGGPAGNTWANNPNCGQLLFEGICNEFDYSSSRTPSSEETRRDFTWTRVAIIERPVVFPYQERVLYNLAVPLFPATAATRQWQVGYLDIRDDLGVRNFGILPSDTLFQSDLGADPTAAGDTSLAPNILLFPHYPPMAFEDVPQQSLTFEFDLPLPADVTIDLLDANDDPIPNTTVVDDEGFPAGWSTVTRRINIPIQAGYAYRIMVERGERENPVTWYVGQYIQDITISSDPPPQQIYLPIIIKPGIPSGINLIRNGDFSQRSPLPDQATQPAYWQVQTIINTEDGQYNDPLEAYAAVVDSRMRLRAAPRARQELRQRINLPGRGDHLISFDVEVAGMPNASASRLEVRYRTLGDGPVPWQTLRTYMIEDNGIRVQDDIPVVLSSSAIVLSFLATFDENDETTVFRIDNVRVERREVDCVPGEPCSQVINLTW